MTEIPDPVTLAPVDEIALPMAPLVRVIAQVRFPLVVAIEQREFVAPFQEAIRADYPRLRQEQAQSVMIGPGGLVPVQQQRVWRFSDIADRWRVTLAPDFLALETTAYTSRVDFFAKLRAVVAVLGRHVEPRVVDRLGIRYIDRLTGEGMARIADMVRAEVRGVTGTVAETHLQHSLTESLFLFETSRLLARWGRLPAGATVDPGAIEAADEASWILDLDMFTTNPFAFNVDGLASLGEDFARRIYTFFRWAVTDEFLQALRRQAVTMLTTTSSQTQVSGILVRQLGAPVVVGLFLFGLGTSSATAASTAGVAGPSLDATTSAGVGLAGANTASTAITELRRRSGLTWEQLARLFGVSRRTLHFWASGKAMAAANEEHLQRVLAVLRRLDRGFPGQTRAALLEPNVDDVSRFDLLRLGLYEQALAATSTATATAAPSRWSARATLAARAPLAPEILADALQDRPARRPRVARAAISVKARRG